MSELPGLFRWIGQIAPPMQQSDYVDSINVDHPIDDAITMENQLPDGFIFGLGNSASAQGELFQLINRSNQLLNKASCVPWSLLSEVVMQVSERYQRRLSPVNPHDVGIAV